MGKWFVRVELTGDLRKNIRQSKIILQLLLWYENK